MKIGLLTFHSQLNYGGVLQCWALQTALEQMGHEIVVIDRWLEDWRNIHDMVYDRMGWRQWAKFWIRSFLGLGDKNPWLRVQRTKRFITRHLHLTPYHFIDWNDAPKNLGIDMLVVGSDQIWHCGDWGDPRPYLLDGAPTVPAIAYAASFGMTEIPQWIDNRHPEVSALPFYKSGLARFKALSCRESEGVELCKELGFESAHVVDPTLLVDAKRWHELISANKSRRPKGDNRRLVCYFLSEDFVNACPMLAQFTQQNNCDVDVFVMPEAFFRLPSPFNWKNAKRWMKGLRTKWFGRVNIRDAADPIEFVSALSSADWVVSDSFHALMFSLIFSRNVRIIKPKQAGRSKMFSRIEEFVLHMNGPVLVDSLDASLNSLQANESISYDAIWLGEQKAKSVTFLSKCFNVI